MGRCHHTTEATGTAPTEMGQSIQLVLIVSLLSLFPASHGQGEECCAVKVVENSPDSSLDGTYTLSDNGAKREEICIDGCVYERDGLEYCFISKPVAESADVQCDDGFTGSTEFPGTGSTGTGSTMSPVSMDMTGSTFDGSMPTGSTFDGSLPTGSTFDGSVPTGSTYDASIPTGSTSGSTIAPTTESVEALSQRASAASEAKDAAEAEIAAAAEKKEAAESVSSELGAIDMNNFKDGGPGRRRRQSETTTTYAKPGSCSDVKTAMDDITNALDGTNDATYNPTRALAIVAILKDLTSSDLADQT